MGGGTFGGVAFGQYAGVGSFSVIVIQGDEVTTGAVFFRRTATSGPAEFCRSVTANDSTFRRTVTTADAER